MREGKKLKAQYIFHRALMEVKLRALGELKFNPNADVELDPYRIFDIAIENARPCMDLAKVGKRGLIYKVPSTISPKRSRFMAIRWMIESAYPTDSENTLFEIRLAKEIYNSFHLRVINFFFNLIIIKIQNHTLRAKRSNFEMNCCKRLKRTGLS